MRPRKTNGNAAQTVRDRNKVLGERLKLIKQRYHDLILRPRSQLISGLMCDAEEYDELEEAAELDVVGNYALMDE